MGNFVAAAAMTLAFATATTLAVPATANNDTSCSPQVNTKLCAVAMNEEILRHVAEPCAAHWAAGSWGEYGKVNPDHALAHIMVMERTRQAMATILDMAATAVEHTEDKQVRVSAYPVFANTCKMLLNE